MKHDRVTRHPGALAVRGITGIVLASVFSALSFTEGTASAENIIANGGFETGASGWWGGGMKGGGVVSETPAEGLNCLKVLGDFVCQDKRAITGGQRYKITMKIRSDAASEGSVYVQLSYRGTGVDAGWNGPAKVSLQGRMEKAVFVTGGTHDWKEFSVVVNVPEGANQALVYLRKINGSAGAAYFDDVKMESTGEAVPAAPEEPEIQGNMIVNGGFENGVAGWWGGGLKNGGVVEEQPGEGAKCLKVTGDFVCQDKRPVRGGKRYRVSMKVRSDAAPEGSVFVQASFRGQGVDGGWVGPAAVKIQNRTEKSLFTTGGTQPWKDFTLVVEAPPNARELLLYLRKISGTEGAAYYDAISVEVTQDPVTTAAELRRQELVKELLDPSSPNAAAALRKSIDAGSKTAVSKFDLVKDGVGQCHIHVGTGADVRVLAAARDLASYLQKISGADVSKLSHDGNPADGALVIVGRDNEVAKSLCKDVAWESLGEDGFVIRSAGTHLVIAGNTPGGTMYGVNWFLDRKLGVKWVSPDYTHIPASKTISVPALNEKQVPRFAFRQILSFEGQDKPFAAHNLLNGNSHGAISIISSPEIDHWNTSWQKPGVTGSFYELMPPKQFKDMHPDWYYGGQVAMMNQDYRQALADVIVKKLKASANYSYYWFGVMDNDWGWDMDPASAAFAKEHGGVASAAKLDLMTDVLGRVRKVLPQAKLTFNAYHWGFTPPTGMTVPEGLLVFPMTIHVDYSTPLNKGRNEKLGKDIAAWNAISKDILVWDHVTNFNGFIQPTPNIYPICESIRWLGTLPNVHGYFAEGSWNTRSAEFAALRVWIMGRMLWDPSVNYDTAIREYCDAYFGPAGGILKEYIDLMHAVSAKTRAAIWEKTNVDSAMLTLDFVTKADALFEKAEAAAASNPEFLKHVRQARVCVDYVILVRAKDYTDEVAAAKVKFNLDATNRLARFNQTIKDEKITQYRQSSKLDELAAMIALDRKIPEPPEKVRGLPKSDWREIGDLGFNRYYSSTVIVPDSLSPSGASVRLPGNQGVPVIQLKHHKLPEEGRWDIYAEVRVDNDTAGDDETALGVGSAPPQSLCTNIKLSQLKKDGYTLIKAPGGPFRYSGDEGTISFVRGGNKNIKYIYVNRFILVRVPDDGKK